MDSPRDNSRKRLWMVLEPGETPHESRKATGTRVRSQEERESGEEKVRGFGALAVGFMGRIKR